MKYNKALRGIWSAMIGGHEKTIPQFAHELFIGVGHLADGWERGQGAHTGGCKADAADFEFTEVVWSCKVSS